MQTDSFMCLAPTSGFHRVAYFTWGAPEGRRATMCVHGLTRTGRDFDHLAAVLAEDGRFVVCPDVCGRGASDWLLNPADYGYPVYLADMAALLGRIGAERVDWVGTSMGGILGMMLAAQPNTPIRRLVLNDIGPFIGKAPLVRISEYVGLAPDFPSLDAVEAYLRDVHAPFGPLSDAEWRHLAEHSVSETEPGKWNLRYDPHIGDALRDVELEDIDLWPIWDAVQVPTMVLRGAESDILLAETAEEMKTRGPKAEVVEVAGVGHAPALMAEDQIAAVRDWLAGGGD